MPLTFAWPQLGGGGGLTSEADITYTDYVMPDSIDYTGATDVGSAMRTWLLANVPSGADATHHSRVLPRVGAVYKIDTDPGALGKFALKNSVLDHVTFDGRGYWSTFPITQTANADSAQRTAVRASYAAWNASTAWVTGATFNFRNLNTQTGFAALFFTENVLDVQICGWTADGLNPYAYIAGSGASTQYGGYSEAPSHENDTFAQIRGGSSNIRVHDNFVHRWSGFSVTVNNTGIATHPDDIEVYRNYFHGAEMGPAVIDGSNIEIHHNVIQDTLYSAFDIESEDSADVVSDIDFHHNIIDTHSLDPAHGDGWFFAANPDALSGGGTNLCRCDRVNVRDNYVKRGLVAGQDPDNNHNIGGLSCRVQRGVGNDTTQPEKTDIVVTRNYTDHASGNAGPSDYDYVANFQSITNLQFTNNEQPLGAGSPAYLLAGTDDVNGTVDITTGNET